VSLQAPFAPRALEPSQDVERQAAGSPPVDDPLTLSRWVAGILIRWRLVLLVVASTIAVAMLALVVVPPVYQTQTVFVANASGGSRASGVMGALGGSGLAGMASQLGLSGSTDPSESPVFYATLFDSRELLTRLVLSLVEDPRTPVQGDSVRLLDLLRLDGDSEALRVEKGLRKLRDKMSTGYDSRTNMVTLIVSAEYPELAAAIANRAIELVKQFNLEQRQSRGRAKREFLDRRLREARAGLATAESAVRQFQELNRQYQNSPKLRLREAELRRQVDLATDLFLTIQREREQAQLAEMNDAALISVVDSAVPPVKAVWPRPYLALATASFVGLVFGVLVAGLATVISDWARKEPGSAAELRGAMGQAWTGLRRLPRSRRPAS
jgi:uncharacterized protein involved in exopolysaccharide biosynthesis